MVEAACRHTLLRSSMPHHHQIGPRMWIADYFFCDAAAKKKEKTAGRTDYNNTLEMTAPVVKGWSSRAAFPVLTAGSMILPRSIIQQRKSCGQNDKLPAYSPPSLFTRN